MDKVKYVKPEAKDLGAAAPILGACVRNGNTDIEACANGNTNFGLGHCANGNDNNGGFCMQGNHNIQG